MGQKKRSTDHASERQWEPCRAPWDIRSSEGAEWRVRDRMSMLLLASRQGAHHRDSVNLGEECLLRRAELHRTTERRSDRGKKTDTYHYFQSPTGRDNARRNQLWGGLPLPAVTVRSLSGPLMSANDCTRSLITSNLGNKLLLVPPMLICALVLVGLMDGPPIGACSDDFVLAPDPRAVVCTVEGGIEKLSYEVDEPWPANRVLNLIQSQMRKRHWAPLQEDFLNPDVRSSHLAGWRSFEEDGHTVHQWLAQWSTSDGRVAWYALLYKCPKGDQRHSSELKVMAALFDQRHAAAVRESAHLLLGIRGKELSQLAVPCVLSEPGLHRAKRAACSSPAPAPTRLGASYNLSLLRETVARVTGASSTSAQAIKDGWYGACSSISLAQSRGAAIDLDLGGIYQLTGVAVTAEATTAYKLTILAGSRPTEMSEVESYEGILAGKRLFTFPPLAARIVRLSLAGSKGDAPVRLEEVEVYGGCL